MTDSLKDPIKFIEEMLRKARRGEVVLTGLRIKNTQPDRWERGAGPDRLRMDNRFMIEMEMYAPDRGARTQPPMSAVAVDIDPLAADVVYKSVESVVLQSRSRYDYRIPSEPYNTLMERIMRVLSDKADQSYTVLRMPYDVHNRLTLMGVVPPLSALAASPAVLFGLDLIVEPPGSGIPVFEDDDNSEWADITPEGYLTRNAARRTVNEMVRAKPPTKPKEPAKPKTPAGASAAREIIFDD